jgi:hypothetical protein
LSGTAVSLVGGDPGVPMSHTGLLWIPTHEGFGFGGGVVIFRDRRRFSGRHGGQEVAATELDIASEKGSRYGI